MKINTKVFILYTGGTIGMAAESEVNPVLVSKPLNELLDFVPGWDASNSDDDGIYLEEKGITLTFASLDPVDSSDITPEHWVTMGVEIEKAYEDHDGFVILHGTDTMAYTASALAFIFENLAKPVVVTGSQLPISHRRTDAVMNLVNAVEIAAWKVTGLPLIPEVIICFADRILRGCRASKVSSIAWAGFDSPNYPHLGEIGEHIQIRENLLLPLPSPRKNFQINQNVVTSVVDVSVVPGFKPSQLLALAKEAEGMVLRTYGAGNAPSTKEFLKAIENITAKEKNVVNITQCSKGMVEMGLYAVSSGLLERGVISGLDMTPEAALTKMMCTIGNAMGEQVALQMQVSQRGEQSENLFDLRYGDCFNKSEAVDEYRNYRTPDRRFDVTRLSRAVIRFSSLGVTSEKYGDVIPIKVYMNLPSASFDLVDHTKCIAHLSLNNNEECNLSHEIDYSSAFASIGDGDITLSIVVPPEVKFWFDGLYLALFAKS